MDHGVILQKYKDKQVKPAKFLWFLTEVFQDFKSNGLEKHNITDKVIDDLLDIMCKDLKIKDPLYIQKYRICLLYYIMDMAKKFLVSTKSPVIEESKKEQIFEEGCEISGAYDL